MTSSLQRMHRFTPALALLALLGGCASGPFQRGDGAPSGHVNVDAIPDAVPRHEPLSKYGNPPTYIVHGKSYTTLNSSQGFIERGIASWYGTKFHGRRTSSGETYNMYAMTAAHKTLPLPTYVEVTNLDNGRRVIVKVNDRGPFHDGRIIDLSYAAAIKLGINTHGTGRVEIRAIDPSRPQAHRLAQQRVQPTAPADAVKTAPDAASDQHLYLQVGAFNSRLNAENLRRRLAQMAGSPVHIFPGSDPTQPVYRVRIGPLASDQEAQQLASRLVHQGITNTSVVID
ncbi:hypothetical protein Tel_15100 [Candidatus Tenderia electrophaga]|jgi:rare lipoprotein A|uniref:Endolytic peptidoglycan transglycosylase RlpA n=1 Tax=Candidatus Tenderia electrophaga TaxID=1748243 RepID=A0A0S2TGU3_9GAMM|nr:hypothetical protein Tel_15100 [Candidatus Tenderia electrophaga]